MIKFIYVPGELETRLESLDKKLNIEHIADAAAAAQLNRIRTRFLHQESTDGSVWPESAAARRRAQTGRGGGTLFDTGRLFHSIGLEKRGKGERSLGTNVPYARKHQFGEDGLPKREFIGVSADDAEAVTNFTSALIARIIAKN